MADETLSFTERMPEYLCHKKVRGLKIEAINKVDKAPFGSFELVFENKAFHPIVISDQLMRRSHFKAGGYLVRYEDGYISYSPAKAFEDGYKRVGSKADPLTPEELNNATASVLRHELKYPETPLHPRKP